MANKVRAEVPGFTKGSRSGSGSIDPIGGTTWQRITQLADDFLPQSKNPSSVARSALCRHASKVGAEWLNWARSDLCGGLSAMKVPAAIN